MLSKRKLITLSEASAAGKNIADFLVGFMSEKKGKSLVLSFASYKNEPDTDVIFDIIHNCFENICIAYPRVSDDGVNMEYYIIHSVNDLISGYKGIREPKPLSENHIAPDSVLAEYDNVYVIVPGLAFDKRGYRVGYGGGFYDRYLKRLKGIFIGICYDFQYIHDINIETDIYDVRCDYIITDRRIIRRA
jgi:5-formyltetrahydrofolate cyclo-ligase